MNRLSFNVTVKTCSFGKTSSENKRQNRGRSERKLKKWTKQQTRRLSFVNVILPNVVFFWSGFFKVKEKKIVLNELDVVGVELDNRIEFFFSSIEIQHASLFFFYRINKRKSYRHFSLFFKWKFYLKEKQIFVTISFQNRKTLANLFPFCELKKD